MSLSSDPFDETIERLTRMAYMIGREIGRQEGYRTGLEDGLGAQEARCPF